MLKMRYQVFSFANKYLFSQKGTRISQWQEDVNAVLIIAVLAVSQFFNQDIWGKRSLCPWNQPHFLRNSDKSLISLDQNKLKEIWDTVCRRERAEHDNAKINVSANIPCTFFLFKGSAFLHIFFPIKMKFNVSFS